MKDSLRSLIRSLLTSLIVNILIERLGLRAYCPDIYTVLWGHGNKSATKFFDMGENGLLKSDSEQKNRLN